MSGQRKRRELDAAFLSTYVDVKIEYPFCYKTKGKTEQNYFRYLEDGRYEYICISEKKMHMSFGTRVDSIQGLMDDDTFYFKTLHNREEVITNEDFEFARSQYYNNYKLYLSGDKYLSREVEDMIALENLNKQEEESFLEQDNKSIDNIDNVDDIINNNLNSNQDGPAF